MIRDGPSKSDCSTVYGETKLITCPGAKVTAEEVNAVRERIKYREDIPPDQIKGLEMAREILFNLANDAGINIEELNN